MLTFDFRKKSRSKFLFFENVRNNRFSLTSITGFKFMNSRQTFLNTRVMWNLMITEYKKKN